MKLEEKARRSGLKQKSGKDYLTLLERAKENTSLSFSKTELEKAFKARKNMACPTNLDQANIVAWLKDNGIECYGSLCEADQQMVRLEKDGVVDGIITEDGDLVVLGANVVFCKMKIVNGEPQFKVYKREDFFSDSNPFQSKLCTYGDLNISTQTAILLGCDYMQRIPKQGEVAILGSKPKDYPQVPREKNGLIDDLAAEIKQGKQPEWLDRVAALPGAPDDYADRFDRVLWYMKCAPTLSLQEKPLNELPTQSQLEQVVSSGKPGWVGYLGDDCGLGGELMNDQEMLDKIYKCDGVLPLKRKPLSEFSGPTCRLFEDINFDAVPISIQPNLVLITWLDHRGVKVKHDDSRESIETKVRNCLAAGRSPESETAQPEEGQHNGEAGVKPRSNLPAEDVNWKRDYFDMAKKVEAMTDETIDKYIGPKRCTRPALRERVDKLVRDGNYNPKSFICRKVECRETGDPLMMLRVDCLSSKTGVVHKVFHMYEDKEGGKFRLALSSCSCKKDNHFCSHSIGLLFIIGILQTEVDTIEEFEKLYTVNPKLVYDELVLIETLHMKTAWRRQAAQRKRRREDSEKKDSKKKSNST